MASLQQLPNPTSALVTELQGLRQRTDRNRQTGARQIANQALVVKRVLEQPRDWPMNQNIVLEVFRGDHPPRPWPLVQSIAAAAYLLQVRQGKPADLEAASQLLAAPEWRDREARLKALHQEDADSDVSAQLAASGGSYSTAEHFARRAFEWGRQASSEALSSSWTNGSPTGRSAATEYAVPVDGCVCIAYHGAEQLLRYRQLFDATLQNRLIGLQEQKYLRYDGHAILPRCEYLESGIRISAPIMKSTGESPNAFFSFEASTHGAIAVYFRAYHASKSMIWWGSKEFPDWVGWGLSGAARLALLGHERIGTTGQADAAVCVATELLDGFEDPHRAPNIYRDFPWPHWAEHQYSTFNAGSLELLPSGPNASPPYSLVDVKAHEHFGSLFQTLAEHAAGPGTTS